GPVVWRVEAHGDADERSLPVAHAQAASEAVGVFFFQAEDGIRDKLVTGVQTCALPISDRSASPRDDSASLFGVDKSLDEPFLHRSEERRVGKECRSGWWGYE